MLPLLPKLVLLAQPGLFFFVIINLSSAQVIYRPVDVTSKEREITARVEKDREALKERVPHPMSRNSSRQATERSPITATRSPPQVIATPPTPGSPRLSHATPTTSANIRPSISFANAASAKKDASNVKAEEKEELPMDKVTEQVAEISV